MLSEQLIYTFGWASWSSVLAGVVTALAVSIIMTIIGVALGFKVVDPKSADPTSGLGITFGIWSAVSVIISMAAGGFVAGLFAAQRGLEHGFLVWAAVSVVAVFFGGYTVGAAVRSMGNTARTLGSGAAGVAGAVGQHAVDVAGNIAGKAVEGLKEQLQQLDYDQLNEQVISVLRDTGVENLQPEHIKSELWEVKNDIKCLVRRIGLNPSNFDQIVADFAGKEKARLNNITEDFDKNVAIDTLAANRNIPRDEAEQMVNNALSAYYKAVDKAKELMNDAREQAEEAKLQLKHFADQTREKADKLRRAAAKAAAIAALALIIAACIATFAGLIGANCSTGWYTIQSAYLIP